MGRLQDKVSILTGAGSGLGRAGAEIFAREGALVGCVDLDGAAAEQTAATIVAGGGRAIGLRADVTDSGAVARAFDRVRSAFGPIEVLFCNAGIAGAGSATEITEELWDRVIAVDLKSVWLCARQAMPDMLERGAGSIINTASVGGLVGVGRILPYAAAKGGVIAMTRQMAVDFGHLALFLASDEASWITGVAIPVDGGYTAA
ncbi:SDR family NAD(P)-dependent oxidoreductase [Granulicoccus phenolivorans]|uniref:SDR family NAD(P)-dependent oxidoreductase n=1 Tax=Granulicoccus phenolivorans TaxID=266854 RepID=UPI00040F37C8|nr:SDR family oxidoreductase [Granulicoccus phenolivorans]